MHKEKWCDEESGVTLYLGDCKEITPTLKDRIDLILCDPPYGMNLKCGSCLSKLAPVVPYKNIIGDDKPFDPQFLLDLDLPTILWGANWYCDKLPPMSGWLVWDKMRPDTLHQSTCELAWTNCVKGVRRFKHLWNGMMKDSENGESYHPAQKPVSLMSWILGLKWTKDFETVFDPFMGSGTVGLACVRDKKKYIGIEIDKDYYEVAKRRIQSELRIKPLF